MQAGAAGRSRLAEGRNRQEQAGVGRIKQEQAGRSRQKSRQESRQESRQVLAGTDLHPSQVGKCRHCHYSSLNIVVTVTLLTRCSALELPHSLFAGTKKLHLGNLQVFTDNKQSTSLRKVQFQANSQLSYLAKLERSFWQRLSSFNKK